MTRIYQIAVLCMVSIGLSACLGFYEESELTASKVQVQETSTSKSIALSEANEDYLSALARHYERYGDGPVDLTITYDPRAGSALRASDDAARIAKGLSQQGLNNIKTQILPVHLQGGEPQLLVSYTSYSAHAPAGCSDIPGMTGKKLEIDYEYKLGCSTESIMARQVAHPKDLRGRAASDTSTDGRRSSNIIETYRSGEPNEPLDGESASESQ